MLYICQIKIEKMKIELKETFTGEELGMVVQIALFLKEDFHTRQGSSIYWDAVELDFEDKKVLFNVDELFKDKTYYSIMGFVASRGYEFIEVGY